MLMTLGGLAVEGGTFRQRKPLVLLCYLALEGVQPRRHVAELFWPGAQNPLASLSVALSHLRRGCPGAAGADNARLWAIAGTDAQALLATLDAGDIAGARALYRGPFLHGVYLPNWSQELEEWVYATREFLAGRLQSALLAQAEREARAARFAEAAVLAHEAWCLPGARAPGPDDLPRLYALLRAADHPAAQSAKGEAAAYGLALALSAQEARARLAGGPPQGSGIPNNLPPPASPLVGRDLELTEIARLLAQPDCQLLTLTGPGGIGKTRLALQAAHDELRQGRFGDGVYFVELQGATGGAQVPARIARALGWPLPGQSAPLEALAERIARSRLLLILDNLEELPGPAPLPDLLAYCPNLKLLATSRMRLHAPEEWVLPVEGLGMPPPGAEGLGDIRPYDAVELFVQRARRADTRFELTGENLAGVLAVCRAVEGSPLGLELAAAWTRAVPPADIAQEIERDLDFLAAPRPGPHAGHGSMRAVFERSWQLIGPGEKHILRQLSAFRGGFTREAAKRVAGASIPALASLCDMSLLRADAAGRFDWHPLLHRYAREKLAARPEERAEVLARHGVYYLELVSSLEAGVQASSQEALRALDAEFANIGGAWNWALAQGQDALLRDAAFVLARYADLRARLQDGEGLFEEALARLDAGYPAHQGALGRSLLGRAWIQLRLGRYEQAEAAAQKGFALLESHGDSEGVLWALQALAGAAYKSGRYGEAQAYFESLLAQARLQGDAARTSEALGRLGLVAQALGDYEAARERYEESLALSRAQGHHGTTVTQLLNLGALDLNSGRTQSARELFEEGLALARSSGYLQIVPVLLHNLANVACKAGDHRRAQELAREALALVRRSGERGLETGMLATLGWIVLEAGEPAEAEALIMQSLRVAWEVRDVPSTLTALVRLAEIRIARGKPTDASELLSVTIHHPAALTWARKRAQNLHAGLKGSLPEPGPEGPGPTLDRALAELLAQP